MYTISNSSFVNISVDLTLESDSTNITYGTQVDLVCSAWNFGMTTFIWIDVSHGIVLVDIVQDSSNTSKSMSSTFSAPVYRDTTFVCLAQGEGAIEAYRRIHFGMIKET